MKNILKRLRKNMRTKSHKLAEEVEKVKMLKVNGEDDTLNILVQRYNILRLCLDVLVREKDDDFILINLFTKYPKRPPVQLITLSENVTYLTFKANVNFIEIINLGWNVKELFELFLGEEHPTKKQMLNLKEKGK